MYGKTQAEVFFEILTIDFVIVFQMHVFYKHTYFSKKEYFSKITPVWLKKTSNSINFCYKMCNFFPQFEQKNKKRSSAHEC